ncbi:SPOR domain-containing protein [Sungkyunkwania multivorans]|uniref:SPOR domain-containing protein n=1 Tax=Sungkyunkwania multivorans TaxID=1173618 RepID=A0ABW3CZ55_9FLAO
MRLEKYISDLLYRYQCVTVPEFGSFLTHRKPAQIHTITNAFYPPSKAISFNEQLKANDGLLGKYVSKAENISYEKALKKIAKCVERWRQALENDELELKNIGSLRLNEEEKMQFEPSQQVNFLTESFGLASFVSLPISREVKVQVPATTVERELLKEEVEVLEETTPIAFTPEKRSRRPYLQYAAVAAIALMLGTFGYSELNSYQQEQQLIQEEKAKTLVEQKVQEATFDIGALPSLELNVVKEEPHYHIVAGAFRIEANADKKVRQLIRKGYNAERIGKNRYNLHQVSYASFSDRLEALKALRKIKRTETRDAWLLVTK